MKNKEVNSLLNQLTGAIYIRVSTDKQEELSPATQKQKLLEYAAAHGIYIPPEYIFEDAGISGRKAEKRPSFQRMISLAKSKEHPIDCILVWKFSRFARNQEESIVFKSLLKKNGVDVISITETVDGEFGSLIERIIEWMDEYYSIRLSGEVMRGMTENARRGKYQSDAPVGYTSLGNGELPVINPDTKVIPLKCKDMYMSGSSFTQIARHLNDLGYRTKRGNLFDSRGVRYLLENPFYCGRSRWNYSGRERAKKDPDEVIYSDGAWEPLWSYEDYQAIQNKIATTTRKVKSRDVSACKHWLSGLLVCSSCGSTLSYSGSKNSYGFQCWSYAKGQCSTSHFISIRPAEEHVIQGLEDLLESDKLDYRVVSADDVDDKAKIENLKNQMGKLDARLARVRSAFEDGIDTLDEYKVNKSRILSEQSMLQDEIDHLTSMMERSSSAELDRLMLASLRDVVRVLKDEEADCVKKGNAIRSVVDKIVFDRNNTTFTFFLKLSI